MGDAKLEISAMPTKAFFIEMLVKDIQLIPAITDLIDNCVDGARRTRSTGDYDGLWVKIVASATHFRISDNCGGIPSDIARNYAFRFGRPKAMESTPHSVGQFGVGMKRALFKLGKHFTIESTAAKSKFSVVIDVDKWKDELGEWRFKFSTLREEMKNKPPECGTTITLSELHEGVAREFSGSSFDSRLIEAIGSCHQVSIEKGLRIEVNGRKVRSASGSLLGSPRLKPAKETWSVPAKDLPNVDVVVCAGIGESDPEQGGWYVYCNERLVLKADHTIRTGWGEDGDETIPKYHNQFARFRGYAFFDCDDSARLPWTTTKTDVEAEAPLYRATRQRMVTLMRPVIDFLNALKVETEEGDGQRAPLSAALKAAKPKLVDDLKVNPTFSYPEPATYALGPGMTWIKYQRSTTKVEKAMAVMGVSRPAEVGERSFDYYYAQECEKK